MSVGKTIRGAIVLFLVLLSPATAVAGELTDEQQLRELKEVFWPRAYFEQDVALLDAILADEFQMVDADGNWTTKADELAWVRENAPSYDSLVFEIKRLDIFGNGTAIVAGTGTVEGVGEDGPYRFTYESTNVLIKRDGRWRAVASHVSGFEP